MPDRANQQTEGAFIQIKQRDLPSVYRDEEYIRQHTKGMSPEDARKFALDYYGWLDDNSTESTSFYSTNDDEFYQLYKTTDPDEDLPFK